MLSLQTHNMYLELYAIFVNLLNLIRLLSYFMNIYMGIIIITIYLSKTNILLPRNMCYLFEIQCFYYYVECKVTPTPWVCVCVYGYLQFAFSK